MTRRLRENALLYEQRNALYGDNYKLAGKGLSALFPNGVTLKTESDFNRFAIFIHQYTKLSRYAMNFEKGGHPDSLDDQAVYSMMLQELDDEMTTQEKQQWKG